MQRTFIIPDLVFMIELAVLRETPNVSFHDLPESFIPEISAVDRVEHGVGAFSPIARNQPDLRPWYMHTHQEDNLLVLSGKRVVELYTLTHGKVETFTAEPNKVLHGEKVIADGPVLLGWPKEVFHRVISPEGSVSINFAHHLEGFNLDTNFNIYDVDPNTGSFSVIRGGADDQPVKFVGE